MCGFHFIKSYKGQDTLMNAFQDFFIETIEKCFDWVSKNNWPMKAENYAPILLFYIIIFRRLRACENLMLKGYPLDGYALLRDLKDRSLMMTGIAHNMATFAQFFSLKGPVTHDNWAKTTGERRSEELKMKERLIGNKSGLPAHVITELKRWDQLFHNEVHGAKFSFFLELGDWKQKKKLPNLGPEPSERCAMYMNRACEIAWLILRILPYIQPEANAFGTEWNRKKEILDNSHSFICRMH